MSITMLCNWPNSGVKSGRASRSFSLAKFCKDSGINKSSIQVRDLLEREMIIFKHLGYNVAKSFFYTFPEEDCIVYLKLKQDSYLKKGVIHLESFKDFDYLEFSKLAKNYQSRKTIFNRIKKETDLNKFTQHIKLSEASKILKSLHRNSIPIEVSEKLNELNLEYLEFQNKIKNFYKFLNTSPNNDSDDMTKIRTYLDEKRCLDK